MQQHPKAWAYWMLLTLLLGSSWPCSLAGQAILPTASLSPELKRAAHSYAVFWTDSYDQRLQKMAESGIIDPGMVFSQEYLKDGKAAYAAFTLETKDRPDLQEAALLVLNAYAFACDNAALPKAKRTWPTNASLKALAGAPAQGLTEGLFFKVFGIARLRFLNCAGIPTSITEAQLLALPDLDLDKELSGVAPVPQKTVELPEENVIWIREDGGLQIDGKEVQLANLPKVIGDLVKKQGGERLQFTLQTDEQAKYERITEVMTILTKAGVKNVTFTVGTEDP